MDSQRNLFHLDIYNQILDLDEGQYTDYVRIYRSNKFQLSHLNIIKKLELDCGYINALFELGQYEELLSHVDDIIESVIEFNIDHIKSVDVYKKLLFQKAAALANLGQFDPAIKICKSLRKMDFEEKFFKTFHINVLMRSQHRLLAFLKNVAIVGILLSFFLTAIELLVIRFFIPDLVDWIVLLRNTVFISSLSIFSLGYGILYFQSKWKSDHFMD